MLQHLIRGKAQIGAPQPVFHAGVAAGQAAQMRLKDHRLGPRHPRGRVGAPAEGRVDHHRLRHGKGRVAGVEGEVPLRAADLVAHHRIRPFQPPLQRAGIGVQEQLVRVEAMAALGLIGAMGAVAVDAARGQPADMDVPDVAVAVAHRQARQLLAAVGGEEAQFDPLGMGREDGEVHPVAGQRRAHRPGLAGADGMAVGADRGHQPISPA